MRASRAALVGVLTLASLVGACAAVSRVGALQPPSESSAQVNRQLSPQFYQIAAPRTQLGVGIDFYTYPGQNVLAAAENTVAYVKTLHANAISISFPFFMHGQHSSEVYASNETPSPAELATVVGIAEKAGLYVSLRPLLDEGSLGLPRTNWQPDNPTAWFASYQKFLLPYAEMAQQTDIPEFIEGAELSYFGHSPLWNGLVAAIRAVYTGTVVYDSNFDVPMQGNGGIGVTEAVDAYHPLPLPVNASQARVTAGWVGYADTLVRGTVLLEVDIAAVPGAYLRPFQVLDLHPTQLVPSIQVRWFTGACQAVARANLGGIYYWAVGLGQSTTTPPGLADPASWVDGPGAVAVSDCFASLGAS